LSRGNQPPHVPDHVEFTRALATYFADECPQLAFLGAKTRIAAAFPDDCDQLMAQIADMKRALHALPGIWTTPQLGLEQAVEAVRRFLATEYAFLPQELRDKVISEVGWELAK
jgi:hypothetical protein